MTSGCHNVAAELGPAVDPPMKMQASQDSGSWWPAYSVITSPAMVAPSIFHVPGILSAPYADRQGYDRRCQWPTTITTAQ